MSPSLTKSSLPGEYYLYLRQITNNILWNDDVLLTSQIYIFFIKCMQDKRVTRTDLTASTQCLFIPHYYMFDILLITLFFLLKHKPLVTQWCRGQGVEVSSLAPHTGDPGSSPRAGIHTRYRQFGLLWATEWPYDSTWFCLFNVLCVRYSATFSLW